MDDVTHDAQVIGGVLLNTNYHSYLPYQKIAIQCPWENVSAWCGLRWTIATEFGTSTNKILALQLTLNSLVSRESLNLLHRLEKTQDRYAVVFPVLRLTSSHTGDLRFIQDTILLVRLFAHIKRSAKWLGILAAPPNTVHSSGGYLGNPYLQSDIFGKLDKSLTEAIETIEREQSGMGGSLQEVALVEKLKGWRDELESIMAGPAGLRQGNSAPANDVYAQEGGLFKD
jgi:hypothetical protein